MNAEQLDASYTELCHALARAGEPQAMLFLSMACLALISRCKDSSEVLKIIGEVEAQCKV
jgi:hypothetical protein